MQPSSIVMHPPKNFLARFARPLDLYCLTFVLLVQVLRWLPGISSLNVTTATKFYGGGGEFLPLHPLRSCAPKSNFVTFPGGTAPLLPPPPGFTVLPGCPLTGYIPTKPPPYGFDSYPPPPVPYCQNRRPGVCRSHPPLISLLSVLGMCGFVCIAVGDGLVDRSISPPSSCHTWTSSALFCVVGIRRVFDN